MYTLTGLSLQYMKLSSGMFDMFAQRSDGDIFLDQIYNLPISAFHLPCETRGRFNINITGMGIHNMETKRYFDPLVSTIGFPKLVRLHPYFETAT